jgi:hypothetical protein
LADATGRVDAAGLLIWPFEVLNKIQEMTFFGMSPPLWAMDMSHAQLVGKLGMTYLSRAACRMA